MPDNKKRAVLIYFVLLAVAFMASLAVAFNPTAFGMGESNAGWLYAGAVFGAAFFSFFIVRLLGLV